MSKFEDAYFTIENKNITIADVSEVFKNNKELFALKYQDNLVCSRCKQAKLSFVNDKPEYFRTQKNAKHHPDCDLQQDVMTPHQVNVFMADHQNEEEIHRQLESLLALTLSNKQHHIQTLAANSSATGQSSSVSVNKQRNVNKRLPRKRIDVEFTPNDFNCNKLFYGRVRAVWEEVKPKDDTQKTRYKLLLYHINKSYLVCKISVNELVYKYIKSEYKKDEEFDCAIAFAANFKNNTGKKYQSTILTHSERLVMVIL